MKLQTQKTTMRSESEPENEQSIELRIPAWVLTVAFGLLLAGILVTPITKIPEWQSVPMGILILFAGIGYGFWLGGELEWPSWLVRMSPRWAEEDWFIEIKIPNWTLAPPGRHHCVAVPNRVCQKQLPARILYPVACLLLLAGNGLHSHIPGVETKEKAERES